MKLVFFILSLVSFLGFSQVSCVNIDSVIESKVENMNFSTVRVLTPDGQGSGVIIDQKDGYTYVLSADHVIRTKASGERNTLILIAYPDKIVDDVVELIPKTASIVAYDEEKDLCLLKTKIIIGIPKKISVEKIKLGQRVFVCGNPVGCGNILTQGVISKIEFNKEGKVIFTDASVALGSSGGPMFNSNGELIGICQKKNSLLNVGIFLHRDEIKKWLQKIKL